MTKEELAKYIDHTLLAPQAGIREIILLCQEAKRYNFASVCVNPVYVSAAVDELEGSDVKICTVVGFPLGATTTKDKISESVNAIENGADEIDMVINIGAAKDGRFSEVETDINPEWKKIVLTWSENEGSTKFVSDLCRSYCQNGH